MREVHLVSDSPLCGSGEELGVCVVGETHLSVALVRNLGVCVVGTLTSLWL